jgi:N-methylhydantoinase B
VPDSGGAGRHRGGLGIARQIRAMRDGIVFSVRSDGHVLGAPGLDGGESGGTARLVRDIGTPREEELSSKTASIVLAAGETVRIETGGGGGYGDPVERDPAALAADLRSGKLSRDRSGKA